MNENIKWIAAAVAVVGLSVGAVLFFSRGKSAPETPADAPVVALPEPQPEEPAIAHPLPEPEAQEALPPLDGSDALMRATLEGLIGSESVERFILPNELIRHIVVTIDNLPSEKLAQRIRPIKPTPGGFMAGGTEEAPELDPANFERYKPLVQLIGAVDTQGLIAAYVRNYPLFQEAYESLGHPPEYFNDRVIEVIDHLLATPELEGPIALARPNVQFEYADPELESLSAGQKALLRMGGDNLAVVKEKLRQLRGALVATQAAG